MLNKLFHQQFWLVGYTACNLQFYRCRENKWFFLRVSFVVMIEVTGANSRFVN